MTKPFSSALVHDVRSVNTWFTKVDAEELECPWIGASTPTLVIYLFMDLTLCTKALSCWKRFDPLNVLKCPWTALGLTGTQTAAPVLKLTNLKSKTTKNLKWDVKIVHKGVMARCPHAFGHQVCVEKHSRGCHTLCLYHSAVLYPTWSKIALVPLF